MFHRFGFPQSWVPIGPCIRQIVANLKQQQNLQSLYQQCQLHRQLSRKAVATCETSLDLKQSLNNSYIGASSVPPWSPKLISNPIAPEWISYANELTSKYFTTKEIASMYLIDKSIKDKCSYVVDILQDNVGVNDPTVLDFIKFYNEPAKWDHYFRGLSVLLMCQLESNSTKQKHQLKQDQLTLAMASEFGNLANLLHNQVINAPDEANTAEMKRHNKIITVLGDYFMANLFMELMQLNIPIIFEMYTTLSLSLSEGFFAPSSEKVEKISTTKTWLEKTFLNFSSNFAYSFKSVILLNCASAPNFVELQHFAFEFGRYLGFYLQAYRELPQNDQSQRLSISSGATTTVDVEHENENRKRHNTRHYFAERDSKLAMMRTFSENAIRFLEQLPLKPEAKHCFSQLFLPVMQLSSS